MVSTLRSRCRFGDKGPARRDGCRSLDEEKIETDSEIIYVNAINLAAKLASFSEHYQPRSELIRHQPLIVFSLPAVKR
jgi:hypothetical protein